MKIVERIPLKKDKVVLTEAEKRMKNIVESVSKAERIFPSLKESALYILVENQLSQAQHTTRGEHAEMFKFLTEAAPANASGNAAVVDPTLIKMLMRANPQMVSYDIFGTQPMKMPTGLVFYHNARYVKVDGDIALKDEAKTPFGGDYSVTQGAATPTALLAGSAYADGMTTAEGEALSDPTTVDPRVDATKWGEMSFSIGKHQVTAETRALRSDLTVELIQDLKSVHGINAQEMISNILVNEMVAETNRNMLRKAYWSSKTSANGSTPGTWDVTLDSKGRWFQEDAVSLGYAFSKDSNAINRDVRFGRGNFIVVSQNLSDVLAAAERLDTSAVSIDKNYSGTGSTYVGKMGRFKIFIDPFIEDATESFAMVGLKGDDETTAGLFYCPYVALEMTEAVDARSLQPVIGFRSRYGSLVNPYSGVASQSKADIKSNNGWFRKSKVTGF